MAAISSRFWQLKTAQTFSKTLIIMATLVQSRVKKISHSVKVTRDRTDQNNEEFEAEKDIRQNTTDESVLGCYFNGYFYWIQFQATFYGKNICNEYFR